MEKDIAIFFPPELIAKVDGVAHAEMRSRANTAKWLMAQALRSRELAEAQARSEAS